jgi:hypothetical protein
MGHFYTVNWYIRSRVSSGNIVSDYGLNDRAIGDRSPVGAKDFSFSLCVQTGSGAHPASCTMGNGGPFPGGKAQPGRDADHSPHLVLRSWMSRSYTPLPSSASMACRGTALLLLCTDGKYWNKLQRTSLAKMKFSCRMTNNILTLWRRREREREERKWGG